MTGNGNWFAWRALAAVVLIALLVAGGFAIHRLGWSQGYTAAELVAEGEEAPTPPLAPPGWRPMRPSVGGLLVTLLLGLIALAFVGKLLRVVLWGALAGPAMGGPWMAGSWRHHWHRMHGPVPPSYGYGPWYRQPGERPQEPDERADAEA
jgi:hypothetical protein